MSGGGCPPAMVPVIAGLCRSLGCSIFLYTCTPGLPGMKTAMLAPRNKKCEEHFPSRQHRFCTSLEVFFLVVRVTRRKKHFFSSPCGAPFGGPSGGLGPAPPPPHTHPPPHLPPLLLSNRTKARGHITNVRQRPAVHLASWVRYTLLALSAASCITPQKVIPAKFERTIPCSRKCWPHHRPHPANEH